MTGFSLFSNQCKYRKTGYGVVVGYCTFKSFGKNYYCSHYKNLFTYGEETYCKRCCQSRCPYYSKEQKDESYCRMMNLRLSLQKKKHEQETSKTNEFYNEGWNVYRADPSETVLTGDLLEKLITGLEDSEIQYDQESYGLPSVEGVLHYERTIPETRRQSDFRFKHRQSFEKSSVDC